MVFLAIWAYMGAEYLEVYKWTFTLRFNAVFPKFQPLHNTFITFSIFLYQL